MQIIKQKPHPSLITLPSYDPTFKEEIPVLHTVEFVPSPWPVATPQFSVTLCICLMNESSPNWASYLFSSPHPFSSAEEVFLKSNQVNPGSECLYGQILNPLVCHKICCCSVAKLCRTLCDPINCNTPEFSVLHCLLEFAQIHVHWVGDAIQPPHPLLPCSPPASIFLSIRVFSNKRALHIRWPKYWSFSFSISPSDEYSGLISFRTDWFELLAVQGTLKSLLQSTLLPGIFCRLQRTAVAGASCLGDSHTHAERERIGDNTELCKEKLGKGGRRLWRTLACDRRLGRGDEVASFRFPFMPLRFSQLMPFAIKQSNNGSCSFPQ